MWGLFLAEAESGSLLASLLIGGGLAVMAATVVIAAVATGSPPKAGMAALGAGTLLAIVGWVVLSNEVPLPAIIGGVHVGASLAVRRSVQHSLWVRLLMAGVVFGYVLWVTDFSPAFAVIVAPLLQFPTVGLSDFASGREVKRRNATGYAAPE